MSIHAVSMDEFAGGIEPNAKDSDCCPDCGGIKSRRAKQCRRCTNQRIGRERVARRKVPGQMKRFMAAHRARQNAEQAVMAMGRKLEREVGRAEREVLQCPE